MGSGTSYRMDCAVSVSEMFNEKNKTNYDKNFRAHKQFANNKTVFAGGICTWTGYAPNLQISLEATAAALESAKEYK